MKKIFHFTIDAFVAFLLISMFWNRLTAEQNCPELKDANYRKELISDLKTFAKEEFIPALSELGDSIAAGTKLEENGLELDRKVFSVKHSREYDAKVFAEYVDAALGYSESCRWNSPDLKRKYENKAHEIYNSLSENERVLLAEYCSLYPKSYISEWPKF